MTHSWIRLVHFHGGAEAVRAGFTPGGDVWGWVQETVATEHECHEDDVGCEESDEGDLVTVRGVAVYIVRRGLPH